ncbi:venom metalloproteinase 3 [Nasonia vitripennis]|uniref:Peptidase M12B domain-containing protein n=1 Tax=Nasonia vitripennis TaxID=7425 RepID=A0A7M7HEN5_NASVI|nr:venom metalloproteinase 3 [Nasonia vitripennis]
MLLKVIIFFILAITSNICTANKEGEDSKNDTATNKLVETILSEVRHIFHRKPDIKNVPRYGIISFTPEKNHSTANSKVLRVRVHNTFRKKKYTLNLVPIENNVIIDRATLVWEVKSSWNTPLNYTYSIASFAKEFMLGKFYQDIKMMAILQVFEKDGVTYYDGAIGESKNGQVVRPFPQKWKDEIYSVSPEDHIVYSVGKKNKKATEIIYPKLIIVVDYTLYEALGSVSETIQYVATFWNAVNLKYSVFKKPKVNILLTGIVIVKDSTAAPYIYKAERDAKEKKANVKLANTVLDHGRAYYSKTFMDDTGFRNYDGTILMTASKTRYLGLAYKGEICNKPYSFAYISDFGDYSGVNTAAHELGHLLNFSHDDVKGNENCRELKQKLSPGETIGSVMNSYRQYVNEKMWSNCSRQALEKLVSEKKADCLRSKIREHTRKA